MRTLSLLSRKLHGCWPVIVRTQRSRCVNWRSSLRCCSTPSSSASSSSTWTAWWTTPWRCTKTGRSWTCGVSRRRRPSERSKQFPSLSKEQQHRCRNSPCPDWSFVLLVFVCLLSFWIISGSSNTPRTLAWLLPFWRERYWLWMLPLPPFFLLLFNIWSPLEFLCYFRRWQSVCSFTTWPKRMKITRTSCAGTTDAGEEARYSFSCWIMSVNVSVSPPSS